MTQNASGGPRSAAGQPFIRVDRGQYVLVDSSDGGVSPPARRRRGTHERKRALVETRAAELIDGFQAYVSAYDDLVPFVRQGQFETHLRTIGLRQSAGSARAAIESADFVASLWATLQKWGIGKRGSRLTPLPQFQDALTSYADEIEALDGRSIEDPAQNSDESADAIWSLVRDIAVVDNKARIVAGTKTLHHLLPNLVVPMDRAWTGLFFAWSVADPQYRQEATFKEAQTCFVQVAQAVQPSRFVGDGWRTCPTKILDNALIGFCKVRGLTV